MKSYIVFSDIHGDIDSLYKLNKYISLNDGAFFAGDGLAMFKDNSIKNFYGVKGNCDLYGEREKIVCIDGLKIFLTHGDAYSVKSGYLRILMRAKELECNAVIFGHTHLPFIEELGGVLLINPGSCSYYSQVKTYAVLTIKDGKINTYINELK